MGSDPATAAMLTQQGMATGGQLVNSINPGQAPTAPTAGPSGRGAVSMAPVGSQPPPQSAGAPRSLLGLSDPTGYNGDLLSQMTSQMGPWR